MSPREQQVLVVQPLGKEHPAATGRVDLSPLAADHPGAPAADLSPFASPMACTMGNEACVAHEWALTDQDVWKGISLQWSRKRNHPMGVTQVPSEEGMLTWDVRRAFSQLNALSHLQVTFRKAEG